MSASVYENERKKEFKKTQYAHKIAEFYVTIAASKQRKNAPKCTKEVLNAHEFCKKEVEPLNTKLHFL